MPSIHRLLLFRHFPATDDEREPGWSGVPIDPKRGAKLARKVAVELAKRRVQLIVGSDLRRSVQTMELVARLLRVPWHATERLRSWNVGPELEGRDRDEIEPELLFFRENPQLKPPGGEKAWTFWTTRMDALRELVNAVSAPPYPRIAAEMHGSVMLLVKPLIEGRMPDPKRIEPPDAGTLVTLEITPRGIRCEGM